MAMANREPETEPGQINQKKGTTTLFPFQQRRLRYQKSRDAIRQQPVASHTRQASRDISALGKRFESLSLGDQPNDKSNGGRVVSMQQHQPLSRPSQSDVQMESTAPSKVHQEEAARINPLRPADSQGTSAPVPTTPPQIKILNAAINTVMGTAQRLIRTPCKGPHSPTKPRSTAKSFLTKESNVTCFTGWDVDGRLNEFESQFKVMKETFEGTMTDRKVLEEAIDLAKNRGMYCMDVATRPGC
jgi:kinesin family protein C1